MKKNIKPGKKIRLKEEDLKNQDPGRKNFTENFADPYIQNWREIKEASGEECNDECSKEGSCKN